MSKETATKKDLEEMGEAWAKKFQTVEEKIGELSSTRSQQSQPQEGAEGGDEVPEKPLYKCKDGKCGQVFDDLDTFVDHKIDHRLKEGEKPAEPEKKRHESVEEFLDCPDCRPKFEKAMKERGWTKAEEAEEEKEESLF